MKPPRKVPPAPAGLSGWERAEVARVADTGTPADLADLAARLEDYVARCKAAPPGVKVRMRRRPVTTLVLAAEPSNVVKFYPKGAWYKKELAQLPKTEPGAWIDAVIGNSAAWVNPVCDTELTLEKIGRIWSDRKVVADWAAFTLKEMSI
jgi:hypothetical protein